jgi:hypothetical protein
MQLVQFILAMIDLILQRILRFQIIQVLSLGMRNLTTYLLDMIYCTILAPGYAFPEEICRIKIAQLVKGIADISQCLKPFILGGKCFQLCLYSTQLILESLAYFPNLPDLRVKGL